MAGASRAARRGSSRPLAPGIDGGAARPRASCASCGAGRRMHGTLRIRPREGASAEARRARPIPGTGGKDTTPPSFLVLQGSPDHGHGSGVSFEERPARATPPRRRTVATSRPRRTGTKVVPRCRCRWDGAVWRGSQGGRCPTRMGRDPMRRPQACSSVPVHRRSATPRPSTLGPGMSGTGTEAADAESRAAGCAVWSGLVPFRVAKDARSSRRCV